ncbi:MAG TPA: hypothetical protein VHS05_31775 [Pyrinomonadaceae bacterium]|jgi:hypothetical protein|nr:hypothetical protein [Pyrinomonadaceae bacterium]
MLHRFGCVLCAAAFALCNCTVVHLGEPENANAPPSATTSSSPLNQKKSTETIYFLDLDKPELEQPIDPGDAIAKFVQVEVTEVTNPQSRPAQFEVRYQPKEGERILLGSFSLYPPNKPGRFIVPTQGKVKGEGKLVLSLVKSDRMVAGDVVRVGVKKLKFVNDVDH